MSIPDRPQGVEVGEGTSSLQAQAPGGRDSSRGGGHPGRLPEARGRRWCVTSPKPAVEAGPGPRRLLSFGVEPHADAVA